MKREEAYRDAVARADARKAALISSALAARARLTPARLKRDAKDKATETLMDGAAYAAAKVQQRPAATAAATGALALYLLRRPLGALFRQIYVRISNRTEEISETDDG
ncbi:hypothetical protein A0J57_06920 [Sphingobium sp. 22B]|uniref:hypothetical protein n=1 Tax=unclassified Sphingobium TaxID=2611147 RepID=UPI00065C8232|nr:MULTISPECIES: hypothetical protein [unclassified Sphingobium]KXU32934.1 hypothetical protein AXW74_04950 [Sphingobium sp. AM]KYC33114.1 hypothetical protein A0J57_06920 [Sphingobium sp. 22B]OAP33229.1 hypothetical protein A8O16_05020 [Sphingobium sp. 20006FA]